MKFLIASVLALTLPGGLAWANGEEIRYDPNTGVILPAGPTQAQVEREKLEIEFQAAQGNSPGVRMVVVQAQYWLRNLTDKPLKLKIGFPAPGGAIQLIEPPVRVDGRPGEWRLLDADDLLKPMQPQLIRAMQRWADRHPRAVQLAESLRELYRPNVEYSERKAKEEPLRRQLSAELAKMGVSAPSRDAYHWLCPSSEVPRRYAHIGALRRAIDVTGQYSLLPEGRWQVDRTVLDPVTGAQVSPYDYGPYPASMSMLVFPLDLQPQGRHLLEVRYCQSPSGDHEVGLYHLGYILRTVRGWASFGPIETTIKAPAGLIFRSLPRLSYAGMSGGQKVYRGTILQPRRNLQVVLASPRALLPRLKINGRAWYGRRDMLVHGTPAFPTESLGTLAEPRPEKRMEQGEVVLIRKGVEVRARPGEKRMLVNGQAVALRTPVVIRQGTSYLPLEILQALYPDYEVALVYHAASRTVLASAKPKPATPTSSAAP